VATALDTRVDEARVLAEAPRDIDLSGAATSGSGSFGKSQIVNADGDLLTVFHGSRREFAKFDHSFIGYGNDMWGVGFYFTDREEIARVYAFEPETPESNVKQFHLNLENPIYMDGAVCTGMGGDLNGVGEYRFGKDTASRILAHHPRAFLQPGQRDGDRAENPLSDYNQMFRAGSSFSRIEIEDMIACMVDERFPSGAGWFEMWRAFGRKHGALFLKAVRAETGHDGVVIDFGDDETGVHIGRHYVAWFSDQIVAARH